MAGDGRGQFAETTMVLLTSVCLARIAAVALLSLLVSLAPQMLALLMQLVLVASPIPSRVSEAAAVGSAGLLDLTGLISSADQVGCLGFFALPARGMLSRARPLSELLTAVGSKCSH